MTLNKVLTGCAHYGIHFCAGWDFAPRVYQEPATGNRWRVFLCPLMRTIDYIYEGLKELEALLLAGDTDEAGKVVRELQDKAECHREKYPEVHQVREVQS